MNRRRVLATLVLAAGAAASVATSQATWELEEPWTLPSLVLDPAAPLFGYQVRAELRGPLDTPYGSLVVAIDPALVPGTVGPAWLTVTIQSDDVPENVVERSFMLDSQTPPPWYLSTDIWATCQTPCVETYSVWLEMSASEGATTALAIDGSITVTVTEVGDRAPSGTALEVEVTPIEGGP